MSSNASTTLRHPTPREQNDRLFNAVWEAIKEWDIRRSPANGYAGASGTDVCTILDAIVRVLPASSSFSKTLHELAGRPPDSPPQIVSAQDFQRADAFVREQEPLPRYWHEWVTIMSKYASSSNAALLDKIQQLRFKLYHYAPFDGKSHTTACSIWREDGQGHAEGFAESRKYTVADLVAQGDGLREALREQKRNAVEIIRLRQKDIDPDSINISPEWVVAECNKALGAEARLSGTEKGTK